MVRGSCLCAKIAWRVSGELQLMSHCHCSMCRKTHGSAFSSYVLANAAEFSWLRGEGESRLYESSPGFHRPFCPTCGSVVPHPEPGAKLAAIPAGCLDDDPGVRPMAHILVGSKAPWHTIHDALPQHAEYPPGWGGTVSPPTRPSPPRPGVVRGSCLCGAVSFELSGRLGPIKNCHCSRDRKAASAAHDSQLGVARDAFRWTRGEQHVSQFKLPESRSFFTSFCSKCGSAMPTVRRDATHVGVPAGSLDDDPGTRARFHIFVGSKAPWFEITDDLPAFDAYPPQGWTLPEA